MYLLKQKCIIIDVNIINEFKMNVIRMLIDLSYYIHYYIFFKILDFFAKVYKSPYDIMGLVIVGHFTK